jgi:beta-xylosidase
MTSSLTARAPVGRRDTGSTPTRGRFARASIAALLLVVALGPSHGAVTPMAASRSVTRPATIEATPPEVVGRAGSQGNPPARTTLSPHALAPAPPADRRDAPDPFVLADDRHYVLYTTQVGLNNVPVATSSDLRHWSPSTDALPRLPDWAAWGRTWAPGVVRLRGRYVLYFAAQHASSGRQCIGVAVSATATGPFAPVGSSPLVCQVDLGGSIDPDPFVDRDGTVVLLWKSDGNAKGQTSTLFGQRLAPDGLTLDGQPSALVTSGAPWEQPLIENPSMLATGDRFVLLYSGGWWESAGYAVGYALCASALGPCTKATVDQPLFASAGDEAGPGGTCVITGPAGDQWLGYHAWTSGAVGYGQGGARSLRFARLALVDGRPVITR